MGALRAAELAEFGMIGVGWVYEALASGKVVADDEVAVAYSQDSYVASTVPLINIRFWLERLQSEALVSEDRSAVLMQTARRIFYADRTWSALRTAWQHCLGEDELQALMDAGEVVLTTLRLGMRY